MLPTLNNQDEVKKITSSKELASYIIKSFNDTKDSATKRDPKKDAQILAKLQAGKKLTPEELRYLQRTNPALYAHAMRVQAMIKAIEEKLKHAKSKEEADRIVMCAMGNISKDDPDKEYIVAAINRITKEMHQSSAYNRLPNTDADAKKAKGKKVEINFNDAKDDEDNNDSMDLSDWSPLQEVIDAMPKFEVGA